MFVQSFINLFPQSNTAKVQKITMATDKLKFSNVLFGYRVSWEAFQNDEPNSGAGGAEDYFDDLAAGDISFYEDSSSQENCRFDHEAKDAVDPGTCARSLLLSEVQEVREQRSSAIVQERPCFMEQVKKGTPLPTTEVMPDITGPKAKLRCCESALITNRKATSSKDWPEDLTQDVFWMENDKTPFPQTLKDIHTLDCYAEEQADDIVPVCRLQSAFQVCVKHY